MRSTPVPAFDYFTQPVAMMQAIWGKFPALEPTIKARGGEPACVIRACAGKALAI